ncbi:MAG: succinate dehydrogenase, hydrophobic membrane anchor protein, partial [Proteobacteria bacterium]|nr:succinate dehydrogenase, hydrophobic membrane anchor protein [Pseudomonadota bacterium]
MVTNVTNLGRSGLYDWLIQRFSAVVLAVYTLFILGIFVMSPDMDYGQWKGLFESNLMRI